MTDFPWHHIEIHNKESSSKRVQELITFSFLPNTATSQSNKIMRQYNTRAGNTNKNNKQTQNEDK